MAITLKEVEHIARLSRLKLTDEEKRVFTSQIKEILSYIEKLKELDTEDIEPCFHVLPIKNVMKDDRVERSLPQEEVLENAPDKAKGCFKVPKIIE